MVELCISCIAIPLIVVVYVIYFLLELCGFKLSSDTKPDKQEKITKINKHLVEGLNEEKTS